MHINTRQIKKKKTTNIIFLFIQDDICVLKNIR